MNVKKEDARYLGVNAAIALTAGILGLLMIAEQKNFTIPALTCTAGCIFAGIRDLKGAMCLWQEIKK